MARGGVQKDQWNPTGPYVFRKNGDDVWERRTDTGPWKRLVIRSKDHRRLRGGVPRGDSATVWSWE